MELEDFTSQGWTYVPGSAIADALDPYETDYDQQMFELKELLAAYNLDFAKSMKVRHHFDSRGWLLREHVEGESILPRHFKIALVAC